MKIPFDIKYRPQIESGEYKVETNDHHSVRIICWNKNTGSLERIVALVAGDSGQEKTLHYTEEGLCVASGGNKNKDLFIITPEPELSEFEKGYMRIVHKMKPEDFNDERLKIAKESSAELLELARNELEPEVLERLEAAYKNQDEVVYENGKRDGKAEALKDLPRWNRLYSKENADKIPDCIIPGKALDNRLVHRGFELKITDLEKLPGFNEDEK